ncbi:MAG: hypothetical protein JNK21_09070 [Rhodospirillaceae bacterium]|nr:hypothetical protein [Rhodospirillaceae bacterium]
MFKGLLAGVVAFATLPALNAMAAGKQDFTVVNVTGYTISELYVSPSKASDWEEDILGRDVLVDGDRTDITFSRKEDTCLWDLKVVYQDDNSSAEWSAINLCEVSVVALHYNEKTGTTSATFE